MPGWRVPTRGLLPGMRDTTKLSLSLSRRRHRLNAVAIHSSARGQSVVEFSLVFPLLLVLLLGVADFGRVFAAGITIEAAARNGAEAVAIERLHHPPTTPGDVAYYQQLHELAARTVCHEARSLPNTTYDPGPPETCPDMPVIAVCVHDGQDPLCSASDALTAHSGPVPAGCDQILTTINRDNSSGGETSSNSVEVRVCYHFTTLFNLHIQLPWNAGMNLGDVWVERTRSFVVDCPPAGVSSC